MDNDVVVMVREGFSDVNTVYRYQQGEGLCHSYGEAVVIYFTCFQVVD